MNGILMSLLSYFRNFVAKCFDGSHNFNRVLGAALLKNAQLVHVEISQETSATHGISIWHSI